jgi:hypothetical protein
MRTNIFRTLAGGRHCLVSADDGDRAREMSDQGTPGPLRRHLPGHTFATTFEMGWAEFGNGDLLLEAEARFNALVTTDQNSFPTWLLNQVS